VLTALDSLRDGCTVAQWPSYRPPEFIPCNAAPDYALTVCTVRPYPTHCPACPPQPQSILTLADSHLSLSPSFCFYRYGKWIHAEAQRNLSSIRKLSVLALLSARTVTDTDLPHKQGPCCWFCIESRQIILGGKSS
jgi:hypothetical protein